MDKNPMDDEFREGILKIGYSQRRDSESIRKSLPKLLEGIAENESLEMF